jgi:hypothetical protein
MKKDAIFWVITLLFFSLSAVMVGGCNTASSTSSVTTTTSAGGTTTTTVAGTNHVLAGSWSGEWYDRFFSIGGPMSATITQSGSSLEGTGSINLSSISYSGIGVETGSAEGVVGSSGTTVTFTYSAGNVGTGGGSINGTDITGSGTVGAPMNFGTFTFSGTIDASGDVIRGEFDFTSGGLGTAEVRRL